MMGNHQVRFLGEGAAAMPLPYPTPAKNSPSQTGRSVFRRFHGMNFGNENIWRESKITAARAKQN
jgi:hypothetical protein